MHAVCNSNPMHAAPSLALPHLLHAGSLPTERFTADLKHSLLKFTVDQPLRCCQTSCPPAFVDLLASSGSLHWGGEEVCENL